MFLIVFLNTFKIPGIQKIDPKVCLLLCTGIGWEKPSINSSQQKVSNELHQIREKIYRFFTPHWLGFSGKSRDFFLAHNTPTVMELYSFSKKDNRLVFILDGGYQGNEKSVNNNFQANTYSVQKGKNLLKWELII